MSIEYFAGEYERPDDESNLEQNHQRVDLKGATLTGELKGTEILYEGSD